MSKELTVQEALKMKVGTRFNIDKGVGIVVIKASSEFKEELGEYEWFSSNKFFTLLLCRIYLLLIFLRLFHSQINNLKHITSH